MHVKLRWDRLLGLRVLAAGAAAASTVAGKIGGKAEITASAIDGKIGGKATITASAIGGKIGGKPAAE